MGSENAILGSTPKSADTGAEPAGGWRPIKTAPMDGRMVLVRAGRREFAASWQDGAYENEHGSCGGWAARDEEAAPRCWSDGVCWAVNAEDKPSAQPREWMPLPEAPR